MKPIIVVYKVLGKTYQTTIEIDVKDGISISSVKSAVIDTILYQDCKIVKQEHNAVSANIVEEILFNAIEIVGIRRPININ